MINCSLQAKDMGAEKARPLPCMYIPNTIFKYYIYNIKTQRYYDLPLKRVPLVSLGTSNSSHLNN